MAPPLQGKDTWQCGQDRFLQWFYDQGQGDETWVAGLGSNLGLGPGRNVPLQGRQGYRGRIPPPTQRAPGLVFMG